jgi:hypothetical protein
MVPKLWVAPVSAIAVVLDNAKGGSMILTGSKLHATVVCIESVFRIDFLVVSCQHHDHDHHGQVDVGDYDVGDDSQASRSRHNHLAC